MIYLTISILLFWILFAGTILYILYLLTRKQAPIDIWIAALKSGDYNQGQSQLIKYKRAFCCLGVGMMCLGMHDRIETGAIIYRQIEHIGVPPDEFYDYLGISRDRFQDALVDLNDSQGYSFSEIADYLKSRRSEFTNNGQSFTNWLSQIFKP